MDWKETGDNDIMQKSQGKSRIQYFIKCFFTSSNPSVIPQILLFLPFFYELDDILLIQLTIFEFHYDVPMAMKLH